MDVNANLVKMQLLRQLAKTWDYRIP